MWTMASTQPLSFQGICLGRTGLQVGRLGVASGYGAPGAALERALEHGVNYIYWGSRRGDSFGVALKSLRGERERFVLVIQSYTRMAGLLRPSLESALRKLSFDYTDILMLGMWNKPVPPRILDAAHKLRERGLVRFLAVSTHKRAMVPQFAAGQDFDVVHFRYNAAHPGAEQDIFPYLPAANRHGRLYCHELAATARPGVAAGNSPRYASAPQIRTRAHRRGLLPLRPESARGRRVSDRPGKGAADGAGSRSIALGPDVGRGTGVDESHRTPRGRETRYGSEWTLTTNRLRAGCGAAADTCCRIFSTVAGEGKTSRSFVPPGAGAVLVTLGLRKMERQEVGHDAVIDTNFQREIWW